MGLPTPAPSPASAPDPIRGTPERAAPPPASLRGLLWLLAGIAVLAVVFFLATGDAWFRWFPRSD